MFELTKDNKGLYTNSKHVYHWVTRSENLQTITLYSWSNHQIYERNNCREHCFSIYSPTWASSNVMIIRMLHQIMKVE